MGKFREYDIASKISMSEVLIKPLINHPDAVSRLAEISYQLIGRIWVPGSSIASNINKLNGHLNTDKLPIAFVAHVDAKPVGMCSLRANDGIYPDLTPWLGSLVVDANYQKQGIGRKLIEVTKNKAKELSYQGLYLFTFDLTMPEYYFTLGWRTIAKDKFMGSLITVMECKLLQD